MATIKTRNEKVLTLNERVRCQCCGVSGCCIYPAEYCSSGPEQIYFYGETLSEDPIGSSIYGDTINGVRREASITSSNIVWAIYRTGIGGTTTRSESNCLRFSDSTSFSRPSVRPLLNDSYVVDYSINLSPPESEDPDIVSFTKVLSFNGAIFNPNPQEEFCIWSGQGPLPQDDDGIFINFNKYTCRWEFARNTLFPPSSSFYTMLGYKSGTLQGSPIGSYITTADEYESIVIS